MGARLETGRLADDLGVSITPVRDSPNRLTGEGLVEARPHGGFHVARFNEQAFRELLELNLTLLSVAIVAAKEPVLAKPTSAPEPEDDLVHRTAALFERIAHAADSGALVGVVRNISERLSAARRHDRMLFPDTAEELAGIEQALAARQVGEALRARLTRYHDSRARMAARYIVLLERSVG